ncbi:unnamed protein product, partial [Ixodes hexagonus]
DVTPVHRGSRRLKGRSPEFGLLSDIRSQKTAMATNPLQSPVVFQRPRDPPSFHGFPQEDADDWLEQFERVATFNRWGAEQKLNHVFFALEDSARTWFENQERLLVTWEAFTASFLQAFSTVLRKERAELLLETRQQHPNETVLVFVEEMKRLFRRADPDMAEQKKLRILMRGVKEQLFAGLVRNPPKTIAEFIAEATTIERTLDLRNKQYERPPPTISAVSAEPRGVDAQTLRDTVRIVVREELNKLFPTTQQLQVSSLSEVVREELEQALRSMDIPEHQRPQTMAYAAAVQRPTQSQSPHWEAPLPHHSPPSSSFPPAPRHYGTPKSEVWRTPNRRPLCFHCGEAGHVYRSCPYRRRGLRGFSSDAARPQPGERPRDIERYLAEPERRPRRFSRSPSPHRLVSPDRRPYSEATTPRSPSPRRGN